MTDAKLKGVTIRSQLSGPELFFEMNRKLWHKRVVRKRIQSDDDIPGGDKPYITEEISRMLSSTKHPRTIAVVHFLASSGIRPGGFIDPVLKMSNLEEIEDCFSVEIYAETKFAYWVFLTPEASRAMINYLQWRELKKYPSGPDSPLFINLSKKSNIIKNRKFKLNAHLTDNNVDIIIRHLLVQSGINRKKVSSERYDKAALYGFRKRYDTILKNTDNIKLPIAEKLMAHKTPKEIKMDAHYLRPTREICFVEFKKAVINLTIDSSERQKFKINQQKVELEKLYEKERKIDKLEDKTAELERIIKLMEKYPKL